MPVGHGLKEIGSGNPVMIGLVSVSRKALPTILTVLITAGLAFGQAAPPPPEDLEQRKKTRKVISDRAQELAEDYADVLTELEDLTIDYSEVLADLKSKSVRLQRRILTKLGGKLAKGVYRDDIDLLSSDLEAAADDLRDCERDLRDTDRKAYRVTKSLRGDIEALDMVLTHAVAERLFDEELLKHEVAIHLKETQLELAEIMEELRISLQVLGDSMALIELGWDPPEVPDIPDLSELPDLVDVPDAPDLIILGPSSDTVLVYDVPHASAYLRAERMYSKQAGATGAMKELADSIRVRSSADPITINSPTGDVRVTGWSRSMVRAKLLVEVSSDSRKLAKKLVEDVELVTSSDGDGIRVDVTVPRISDPGTSLDGSRMEIMVPRNNRLVCANSFGLMEIKDVESGVKIKANNSSVVVDEVTGPVTIVANLGSITLTNIEVTNTYAAVTLSGCNGETSIDNSGEVSIVDHAGTLDITNTGGRVEVRDLDGNITTVNSYHPILYNGVTGTAQAENQRAAIMALNVEGPLTISNRNAPITVRRSHGRLDLQNVKGLIDVLIADELGGPSQISAVKGSVELSISQNVSLDVSASTEAGKLISRWPTDIDHTGDRRHLKFSQGDDGALLTVTGKSADIILSRPH